MASRSFGSRGPARPHLARRRGGLPGEVVNVREDVEAAFDSLETEVDAIVAGKVATTDVRLSGLYIPDPAAAIDANFAAAALVDSITEVRPTANRLFNPRTAPTSMGFTLWKSNTAAFGITIDVTTGGNTGWTTDGGLNTNFVVPGSASALAGQWVIRIDLPNKRVSVIPAS